MVTVKFKLGQDEVVVAAANEGEELLSIARKANVAIDAPCSGNGSCGKCKVKLLSGNLESEKTRHISEEEYSDGWRLACISKVAGDVEIEVPDIASAYRSRMKVADLSSGEEIALFRKIGEEIQEAGISFVNGFRVIRVTLDPPSLDDTMPDNERLCRAIANTEKIDEVKLTYTVLKKLPKVLRNANFNIQCIVHDEGGCLKIYDILPSDTKARIYGAAIDIGTTTVSALITDLQTGELMAKASAGNGQIRYGADVINRIIESAKPDGRDKLQNAILLETILPLMDGMCKSAGIDQSQVFRVCIASNTTMNHLLIGVDAEPVRMEPYIPSFFVLHSLHAYDLGFHIHPDAAIMIAPNIGSYVGGDITAGTLASGIWNKDEYSLFIDLGTNGELVFGNNELLMSCACSAGPAFEGGDISCGMRATDGAIEACTIDKETKEPTYEIVGEPGTKPVGICGSGIIDIISELFRCGIIDPKGKFVKEGGRVKRDEYGIGRYILASKEESGSVKEIAINEVDIDNFIRAKGAIFSAIQTMLESLGFDITMVEAVYVAGGIGSGINMKNAVNIGMLPDIDLEKYRYIGNSSLTGAYAMLMSEQALEKVEELARSMTYMELSTNPSYMDEFIAACFLPHTNASLFPSVSKD